MKRFSLLMVFALLIMVGQAQTTNDTTITDWRLLGTVTIDNSVNGQEIMLDSVPGDISEIKLVSTTGNVSVAKMRIGFFNGKTQEINARYRLTENQESRPIRVKVPQWGVQTMTVWTEPFQFSNAEYAARGMDPSKSSKSLNQVIQQNTQGTTAPVTTAPPTDADDIEGQSEKEEMSMDDPDANVSSSTTNPFDTSTSTEELQTVQIWGK
ncbi:hypothetical protein [Pontibacter sp. G13]|uniref:hypothetical protein n=1 Tax=Pontibacter sp. G13 TaxID=3074898 RepID=UPI00288BC228|nr:hypothetical protein [Pontibacter sp. G13]WNJ19888.1 hypothetical protein RJD25_05340 [Pontibacter sp. G13]